MNKINHIVCIDDEKDILEITRLCLETIGHYKVSSFLSAREALEKLSQIKPDVILIDNLMPVMDGFETIKAIQNMPDVSKTPVIFMTARVQADEIQECLDAGAIGVVKKPFDPMKLVDQVEAIFASHSRASPQPPPPPS